MKKADIRDYLRSTAGVKGWFFPIDVSLFGAIDEIQKMEGVKGNLFEIGVHHGKSTVLLAKFRQADESLGVCDIFEEQGLNKDASGKGDREIFLGNMRTLAGVEEGAFKVFSKSSSDLGEEDTTGACRFFHIDGGHWPEIVFSDLKTADRALLPEGVVAVDDVFNPNWPGVGEGFYRFTSEFPGRLVPIIIGANKVFLARPQFAETFRKYCTPTKEFLKLVEAAPFSFDDKDWLGRKVLTAIRHSWVDISPVRTALSHLEGGRLGTLKRLVKGEPAETSRSAGR
jgi:hypothetical protein